jgi:hypothetical protein
MERVRLTALAGLPRKFGANCNARRRDQSSGPTEKKARGSAPFSEASPDYAAAERDIATASSLYSQAPASVPTTMSARETTAVIRSTRVGSMPAA